MVKCPVCGRIIVNEKIYPTCGSALHEKNNIDNDSSNNHDIKFCESCGSKVDENSLFCENCGEPCGTNIKKVKNEVAYKNTNVESDNNKN